MIENIALIPPALLTPRYVVTKVVINEEGIPTKPPTSVVTNQFHNCWEFAPDRLVTIEVAIAFAIKNKYQFVGYCLAKSAFLCVDLDNCFQPNGELKLWARVFVDTWRDFIFYAERSPGVTHHGVHLWFRCDPKEHAAFSERLAAAQPKAIRKVQKNIGAEHEKIELFWSNYVTVTGVAWGEWDGGVLDKNSLEKLYTSVARKDEAVKSRGNNSVSAYADLSLYDMITKPASDFPDHSSAVQALLIKSALKNNCDREKMESDLRQSKLFAHHWEGDKWNRLGQAELDKAVKLAQAVPHRGKSQRVRLNVSRDTEVVAEVILWLNHGLIPIGKVTLFAGDGGVGKSTASTDLAGSFTLGREFPNGKVCAIPAGEVMVFSAEDNAGDTIKPRLMVSGYREGTFHFVQGVEIEGQEITGQVALDSDLALIREYLLANPEIKLVIIDPLSSYFGDQQMNKAEHCRKVLDPLGKLAAELKVAVVVVAHFSKNIGLDAAKKVAGSVAIVHASRLAWGFFRDLDDPSLVHMLVMKSNVSSMSAWSGFKYRVTRAAHPVDKDDPIGIGKIEWLGASELKAEEIVSDREDKNSSTLKDCMYWLKEHLEEERLARTEVIEAGKKKGFAERTIERAAKNLKVDRDPVGRKIYWKLRAEKELELPAPHDGAPTF